MVIAISLRNRFDRMVREENRLWISYPCVWEMLPLSARLSSQVSSEWSTRVCMMVKCQKPWGRMLRASKRCPVWQDLMVMFNNNHRVILQRVRVKWGYLSSCGEISRWRCTGKHFHASVQDVWKWINIHEDFTWFGCEAERTWFYMDHHDLFFRVCWLCQVDRPFVVSGVVERP